MTKKNFPILSQIRGKIVLAYRVQPSLHADWLDFTLKNTEIRLL